MALKKCKECGGTVSSKAKTCPHCGVTVARSNQIGALSGCLVISIAIVVIGVSASFIESPDRSSPPQNQTRSDKLEVNSPPSSLSSDSFPKLDFRLIDEEKYDAPAKTQVVYHALVSGELTEAGLRDVLAALYAKALKTAGLKNYSGRVTHVFVYLYTTEAHFKSGSGQWIAMLSRVGEDAAKDIKIRKESFSQIAAKSEDKFGLSEVQRKEVFRLLLMAQDKAQGAAEEKIPIVPTRAMKVGQIFQLTKETPLMPEMDPADPLAALSKMRKLPAGSYIKVSKIARKASSPWYQVSSIDRQKKNRLGTGWINSVALMGQAQVETKEQLSRQIVFAEELTTKYKIQISQKYKITEEQLSAIGAEGMAKNWPVPASEN